MEGPPNGGTTVARTHAVGAALAVVAVCTAVLALLGAGVRTGFAPQLELDAEVSRALYAGDDRGRWLDVLLEVLTAPGLSLVRYVLAVPVLVWLVRRRAWRTVLWVVVAAVLVAPVTSRAQGGLRPRPAALRERRCGVHLAQLPERPLLGDRHPRDGGPAARLAAAGP